MVGNGDGILSPPFTVIWVLVLDQTRRCWLGVVWDRESAVGYWCVVREVGWRWWRGMDMVDAGGPTV